MNEARAMSLSAATAVVLAVLLWAASLAVYHFTIRQPAPPRIGVLDLTEIYRLKEAEFEKTIASPGATDADRARALDDAHRFAKTLEVLVRDLPQTCRCVVINKAALIGIGEGAAVEDLTPLAKQSIGL